MKLYRAYLDTGDTYLLAVDSKGDKRVVKTDTNEFTIEYLGKGTRENEYLFKVNGTIHRVYVESGYVLVDDASVLRLERLTELPTKEGESIEELIKGKEGEVISPLQGRVVMIRIKEGDAVNKGQPLLSIEAMKSETIISAPVAGIVEKILVKQGQGVKKGDVLLIIK
ncbi:MAG: biotin carboxyl carrier protein of acetyl-CoA carboxylase [Candidatus Aramenus sulfurataquae]|jgi:biotin carboxyl carrier protein|uniref:Acetyl/propionyl-CoA carboxylase n=2 Tax=Candidatus Aramenus sulfurataquae TaxID=1326980 RepID=W7KP78_9CREN|nr:MAG: biotin carboxyl carrier protein of acetyl-CoA carboxylase [Candidatus Aramenus sulfurataquae]MCL7344135.1 biotin/lipoyl-binding protein [Candidatus Aramenus sulfurataquae]